MPSFAVPSSVSGAPSSQDGRLPTSPTSSVSRSGGGGGGGGGGRTSLPSRSGRRDARVPTRLPSGGLKKSTTRRALVKVEEEAAAAAAGPLAEPLPIDSPPPTPKRAGRLARTPPSGKRGTARSPRSAAPVTPVTPGESGDDTAQVVQESGSFRLCVRRSVTRRPDFAPVKLVAPYECQPGTRTVHQHLSAFNAQATRSFAGTAPAAIF